MASGFGLADMLVEGCGIAGTPNGGILTVQGIAGGTGLIVDTELIAALALADALANPTTSEIGANLLLFSGGGATTWDRARGSKENGLKVYQGSQSGASLVQTGKSAANTAQTITLAALGSGHFAAIDYIFISRTATAALAGTAALDYTTTNLNGLAWTVGNAMAIGGTQIDVAQTFDQPLMAAVSNLAVTIVIPACGANVISRCSVVYRDLINP